MRESNKFLFSYRYSKFLKIIKANTLTLEAKKKPIHELDIMTIGVLFDATKVEEKYIFMDFIKSLEKTGAKVTAMGYLDHEADTVGISFRHFTNKDVSWYFIPKNNDIERFLSVEYDVLINADLSQCLSLHYIAAMTQAYLKVGTTSPLKEIYHLELDTKDTFTIKQYISELISILNKVCFNGLLVDKRSWDSTGHSL